MIKDPRQIVTPYAFQVDEELLGLPLATPKRRLAAFLLDLLIAAIISSIGAFLVAITASGIFFWIAVRTKSSNWMKNLFRYSGAGIASILVFIASYAFTEKPDTGAASVSANLTTPSDTTIITSQNVDWGALSKQLMETDYTDDAEVEKFVEDIESRYNPELTKKESGDPIPYFYEASFLPLLNSFRIAVQNKDSVAIDSIRAELAPLIASVEIKNRDSRISNLRSRNSELSEDNDALREKADNPGILRILKSTAEDFGLTIGWIGVYFVLSLALFRGRTLGKKLFSLQVIRLNNKPIGLLYSFERFGGYAAGVATGLLGFAQIYWDPNRQAIHDKIAATVVIDTREKKREKVAHIRKEILETIAQKEQNEPG